MKYKILLKRLPTDEYAHELMYDIFNSSFNSSLYMAYWLFNVYSKASVYVISNFKLEGLVSMPNPGQFIIDELEKHNVLSIIERNKDESVK